MVWQRSIELLQQTGVARRTALAALVQFAPVITQPVAGLDVEGCQEFWAALRDALVSRFLERWRIVNHRHT